MAGKYSDKHVFPILLDGDQVNISDSTYTWNGTSSILRADASTTITVGDATITGTLLNIICKTSDDVLINITTDPYGSNNMDEITLSSVGDQCTLMWTGSGWIILSSVGGSVDAGGVS